MLIIYSSLFHVSDNESLVPQIKFSLRIIDRYLVCNSNNKTCRHLYSISLNQIKSAVSNLKNNNKEYDSVLITNCLKNETRILFQYVSFLFTIMICQEYGNNTFNTIIFNTLVKKERKCKTDFDNYRAIALNSMISKLLDDIIFEFFNQEL